MNNINAINAYTFLLQTLPFSACIISYSKFNYNIDCVSVNNKFEIMLANLDYKCSNDFFSAVAANLDNFFGMIAANKKVDNYLLPVKTGKFEFYFNLFGSPVSNIDDRLLIFAGFTDVSEQYYHQRECSILADVFNFFSNAILIANIDAARITVFNVNSAIIDLCGYKPEEIIGKQLFELPFWLNTKIIERIVKELTTGGKSSVKNRVLKIKRKDGQLINSGLIINCVRDSQQNILRLNIMMSDITERINFRQQIAMKSAQLEVNNKIIKNMTHTITHKFSNYLSPISTYANLWIERIEKNNINRDDLQKTFSALKKILDELNLFIDSSIRLARYDAEIIDIEQINIYELFCKSAEFLNDFAAGKKLGFDIRIPSETNVYGSAFLVREVIDNLLNNAVKYSIPETKIICNCKILKNSYIWFAVENSGRPVPEQYRRVIFKPYYRMPDSFDQAGDGLGLAICANIIKHHKGKIGVIPKKNKGNVFYFTLPRKPEFIIKISDSAEE